MKLAKTDRATLDTFGKLAQYGLKLEFEDKLFEEFFRSALESLIVKLHKASKRIVKALTLQITSAEAICLRWTLEFWREKVPNSYEIAVAQKYFPELNQKPL